MTDKTEKSEMEELKAQMARISANMDAMSTKNEQLQRTNMQLMSTAPATAAVPEGSPGSVDPSKFEVNLENLPDPVQDPKGYAGELAKRYNTVFSARDQARTYQQDQVSSQKTKADALWATFKDVNPQLSGLPGAEKKIGYVAQQALDRAKAMGVDPDKYMYGPGQTQFFEDVVRGYEETFGKVDAKSEGDKTVNKSDPPKGDEDTINHRTGGIFGGAEGGFPSGPDKNDPNDKPGDMLKDMEEIQKKSGYF